jgi:hypothetical protein
MINLDELEQLAKAAITSGLPGDRMMFALKAMDPEGMLTLIAEVRALRERRNGPGTPAARFSYLLHELEALFPGVVDPVLSDSPETKLLDAVRALREDKARLDYLDCMNAQLNKFYDTTYQWKVILSPNIVRLTAGRQWAGYVGDIDLNDVQCGEGSFDSCRKAIDDARGAK